MKICHGPEIIDRSFMLEDNDYDALLSSSSIRNVKLDNKDDGLAPEQSVAIYNIDITKFLGAGVISECHWTKFLIKNEK